MLARQGLLGGGGRGNSKEVCVGGNVAQTSQPLPYFLPKCLTFVSYFKPLPIFRPKWQNIFNDYFTPVGKTNPIQCLDWCDMYTPLSSNKDWSLMTCFRLKWFNIYLDVAHSINYTIQAPKGVDMVGSFRGSYCLLSVLTMNGLIYCILLS